MFRTKSIWPAIAIVVGVQSVALAWMVSDRLSLIKNGKEVVLAIAPVDPRSLFRGDYVILNPDIARITLNHAAREIKKNDEVYIVVQRQTDGTWTYQTLSETRPDDLPNDKSALLGRVSSVWRDNKTGKATLRLRYGIEKYFVPEGTGKALEKKVRERQIKAIVAVGADGTSALKGLEVSGKRLLDPPLL